MTITSDGARSFDEVNARYQAELLKWKLIAQTTRRRKQINQMERNQVQKSNVIKSEKHFYAGTLGRHTTFQQQQFACNRHFAFINTKNQNINISDNIKKKWKVVKNSPNSFEIYFMPLGIIFLLLCVCLLMYQS